MKRLDKDEVDDLIVRLAEWQMPQAMRALIEATMNNLGSTNLFNQSGLSFLRDAWIAAEFGSIRNAANNHQPRRDLVELSERLSLRFFDGVSGVKALPNLTWR